MKHANIAIFVPHLGCPHQCSFCNQRAITSVQSIPTPEDVFQICSQAVGQIPAERRKETEIAFFGGSFTAISQPMMCGLLEAASAFLGKEGFSGIRISTRPDAISTSILEQLMKYGVTSIELGVQSLDDRVLELNGRGHTAKQAEEAVVQIRSYGFSLGLQMMVGLYGDSKESLYHTADLILKWHPDTVRIYPTVVLRGTELEQWMLQGKYCPMELEEAISVCADLLYQFETNGIRVIRLGLHSEREMEKNRIGGPYHPAFRELCENRIFLSLARQKIKLYPNATKVLLEVPCGAKSKMIGQKRCNLTALRQSGVEVIVRENQALSGWKIKGKDVSHCS